MLKLSLTRQLQVPTALLIKTRTVINTTAQNAEIEIGIAIAHAIVTGTENDVIEVASTATAMTM